MAFLNNLSVRFKFMEFTVLSQWWAQKIIWYGWNYTWISDNQSYLEDVIVSNFYCLTVTTTLMLRALFQTRFFFLEIMSWQQRRVFYNLLAERLMKLTGSSINLFAASQLTSSLRLFLSNSSLKTRLLLHTDACPCTAVCEAWQAGWVGRRVGVVGRWVGAVGRLVGAGVGGGGFPMSTGSPSSLTYSGKQKNIVW